MSPLRSQCECCEDWVPMEILQLGSWRKHIFAVLSQVQVPSTTALPTLRADHSRTPHRLWIEHSQTLSQASQACCKCYSMACSLSLQNARWNEIWCTAVGPRPQVLLQSPQSCIGVAVSQQLLRIFNSCPPSLPRCSRDCLKIWKWSLTVKSTCEQQAKTLTAR